MTSEIASFMAHYQSELKSISDILEDTKYASDYIPDNLKYLMILQGFTSIDTIAHITEQDITALEMYASKKLHMLLDENDRRTFYGVYNSKPDLFEIGIGNTKKLLNLAASCKILLGTTENYLFSQRKRKKGNYTDNKQVPKSSKIIENNFTFGCNTSDESLDVPIGAPGQAQEIINSDSKEKSANHIKQIVSNYVCNFIEKNLGQSLKTELKPKILEKLENLEVVFYGDATVTIKCIFCDYKYRAYSHKESNTKTRWVLSNYNQHFKRHFNISSKGKTLAALRKTDGSRKLTLLNFVKINQSTSQSTESDKEQSSSSSNTSYFLKASDESESETATNSFIIVPERIPNKSFDEEMEDTVENRATDHETSTTDFLDQDCYEVVSEARSEVFDDTKITNTDSEFLLTEFQSDRVPYPKSDGSNEQPLILVTDNPTATSTSTVQLIENITLPPLILKENSSNFEQGRVTEEKEVCNSATTKIAKPPSRQHRYQTKSMLTYDEKQSKLTDFFSVIITKIVDEVDSR